MGPFPHDAPPATITSDNPMGTDGFEFVEYAHPNPAELHALFALMGFEPVAHHKTKKITVYRQGDLNYLVNEQPGTHGFDFVAAHGPCAPSMAFRVVDARQAYERAIALGAEPAGLSAREKTLDVPAIRGIGGSLRGGAAGGQRSRARSHHRGMSIECPQWLQDSSAVVDMRTIVECSPQFGHIEVSSKRRRQ